MVVQGPRLLPSCGSAIFNMWFPKSPCMSIQTSLQKGKEHEGERFLGTRPGHSPCQFVPLATWAPVASLEAGKYDLPIPVHAQEGEELGLSSQPVSAIPLW